MSRKAVSMVVLAAITAACSVGCESDNSSRMSASARDTTMAGDQMVVDATPAERTASDRTVSDRTMTTAMPEASRTGGADRYTDTSGNRGVMATNAANGAENGSAQVASARMEDMKISAGDKVFLVCAASSNKAEIAMAQMALKKDSSPAVKQIANHMITDHQMAQDQLMALAKQKGVDIDAKLAPSHETAAHELGKLDGAMFDKAYLAINHGAHLEAIGQFTHASMHADDAAVKAWAAQTLPKLQMHNQMVEQAMGGKMPEMKH